MLCWVLGLLVLLTVSLLVPGVSAGEGVVAFGLGVGGCAGVGVAVTGPGFGRGWLAFAGCGRSPLLAEGLVGLPLCTSGISGSPAAPLAGGCWVLVLWVFVSCVRLWCGRCSRFGVWCAFMGLVLVAAVAVCGVCTRGCVCGVLVVRLGACPCLSGLGLAALCGCRGCVSWHLSHPGCGVRVWFSNTPDWGLLVVVCPPVAPFACPPRSSSLPRPMGRRSPRALPSPSQLWWVGGGRSLSLARVPSPGVSPLGGRCLHSPSGCNSVVRAVHLDPLGTNGPAP